jgi:predicted nucleic acid-binding protein
MSADVFVDTNVLVYTRDASEPAKQKLAAGWMEHLWRTGRGRLSFQVLEEFYVTVTQKLKPGLDPTRARSDVRSLLAWQPIILDGHLLDGAWTLQDRYRTSWWDALIVSAAQRGGCRYLLTEDLQRGQSYWNLQVLNPFVDPPASLRPSL